MPHGRLPPRPNQRGAVELEASLTRERTVRMLVTCTPSSQKDVVLKITPHVPFTSKETMTLLTKSETRLDIRGSLSERQRQEPSADPSCMTFTMSPPSSALCRNRHR